MRHHHTPLEEVFEEAKTSNGDWYDGRLPVEELLDAVQPQPPEEEETNQSDS